MLFKLPNILTMSRIVVIPLLLASLFLTEYLSSWLPLGLFIAAGITDFLDGYIARRYQQTSNLGKFLDPVADKILVASVLLVLVGIDRVSGWELIPAVIILCREIMVSGLREYLAELRVGLPVSKLAKWKTASQILALCFLLGGPAVQETFNAMLVGPAVQETFNATLVGEALLWVAGILTVWTGYDYLRLGLKHMVEDTP